VKLICGHEILRLKDWEWTAPDYCYHCAMEGIDMWVEEYQTPREIAYNKALRELLDARRCYDEALGIPCLLFEDSDDE
jgi:hypothetical protein